MPPLDRIGPGRFAAHRRGHQIGIDRLPGSGDPAQLVIDQQPLAYNRLHHAHLVPFLETPMHYE
ncbi:MAG: hypothetical protein M5U01_09850 [Ardenticatenaceae bacterium]|nr:hypothetical protein [Ardenticatenaceae bacterium]